MAKFGTGRFGSAKFGTYQAPQPPEEHPGISPHTLAQSALLGAFIAGEVRAGCKAIHYGLGQAGSGLGVQAGWWDAHKIDGELSGALINVFARRIVAGSLTGNLETKFSKRIGGEFIGDLANLYGMIVSSGTISGDLSRLSSVLASGLLIGDLSTLINKLLISGHVSGDLEVLFSKISPGEIHANLVSPKRIITVLAEAVPEIVITAVESKEIVILAGIEGET